MVSASISPPTAASRGNTTQKKPSAAARSPRSSFTLPIPTRSGSHSPLPAVSRRPTRRRATHKRSATSGSSAPAMEGRAGITSLPGSQPKPPRTSSSTPTHPTHSTPRSVMCSDRGATASTRPPTAMECGPSSAAGSALPTSGEAHWHSRRATRRISTRSSPMQQTLSTPSTGTPWAYTCRSTPARAGTARIQATFRADSGRTCRRSRSTPRRGRAFRRRDVHAALHQRWRKL